MKIKFLEEIDLGKKYPDYIDKRIIRIGFIFVLIIQTIAVISTGFNFNPAWVECNYDQCDNPFYGATGSVCEQNIGLCYMPSLSKGQIIGNKPNLFVRSANKLSWLCLIIAGIVNYKITKNRRKLNGKRIQNNV